ncbi:hypothetical protein GCM10009844_44140 [Nocardioides koreensis]|uniref:PASTA domain-containing protein n=1 Tax=Nocardioides koreensis TaxID=433651 RepID=A0ABP5M1A1_9ACTN
MSVRRALGAMSAGETVDVAPFGGIDIQEARRAWPLLASSAAAVLVVAAVVAVVVGSPANDGPPTAVEPGQAQRIPPVFGYRANDAATMLQALGLRATVRNQDSCEVAGRALGTSPATGTAYSRGEAVTVLRSTGTHPLAYCAYPPERVEAWAFLDFANGRGPAPPFAERVSLWVDGEHTATLTGDQATDPTAWGDGSALQRLASDSRQVSEVNGRYVSPGLTTEPDDGTQFLCGGQELPLALSGRASQLIYLAIPADGVFGHCAFVNVFRTSGRIDAVVLRTDEGGVRQPR